MKKSRTRYLDDDEINRFDENNDSKSSLQLHGSGIVSCRVAIASTSGILSPPESSPSTPASIITELESGTTSVYDSAMVSAIKNIPIPNIGLGVNNSIRSDAGFSQNFDG